MKPTTALTTDRISATTNRGWAMLLALVAIPPNANSDAPIATRRNITAQ